MSLAMVADSGSFSKIGFISSSLAPIKNVPPGIGANFIPVVFDAYGFRVIGAL